MKKILFISITVFVVGSILGCNMLKGAGKDVENTGKNVQKVVDKND